jgi:hypothetical protein
MWDSSHIAEWEKRLTFFQEILQKNEEYQKENRYPPVGPNRISKEGIFDLKRALCIANIALRALARPSFEAWLSSANFPTKNASYSLESLSFYSQCSLSSFAEKSGERFSDLIMLILAWANVSIPIGYTTTPLNLL